MCMCLAACSPDPPDYDGTALPVTPLESVAPGWVTSELAQHTLGYTVGCGADVDGNGVGDLVMNADAFTSSFGEGPRDQAAIYRTNGPLLGDWALDELEGWKILTLAGTHHALLGPPFRRGLLFAAPHSSTTPVTLGVFATQEEERAGDIPDRFGAEESFYLVPQVVDDVTGDGRPDLVLGGQFEALTLWEEAPIGMVDVATAPRRLSKGTKLGHAYIRAGDVNGDGVRDLVMTASFPDLVIAFGPFVGNDTVLDASNSATVTADPYSGVTNHLRLAVGDFDGDGIDDMALSYHTAANRDGRVWVTFGPIEPGDYDLEADADLIIEPETAGAWLGTAIAAADLDGDGTDTLVIGASMDGHYDGRRAGLVYVLEEPLRDGVLTADTVRMVLGGAQTGDGAGWDVAACDTDDDGLDELIVGAPDHDARRAPRAGRVYWVGELAELL